MHRRTLLKLMPIGFAAGCGVLRINPNSPFIRSPYVDSPEQDQEILSRAQLTWTEDKRIRVLTVSGTAYEMGYQHGRLLKSEIQENLGYLYEQAIRKFRFVEILAEAYERMRPFIPQDYIDEMHGLAHGSELPLHVIHHIHALPELGEWSGIRKMKRVLSEQMAGYFGTTCSNVGMTAESTVDGKLYAVRILDWGMHEISKLHEFPLIVVYRPRNAIPYANISWVGFIGAVSGMNAEGITLGEMGYGSPPNETLMGKPMPFMLRDVLAKSKNLKDVQSVIRDSPGTNSFVFLMTDGKTGEAELYVRDRDRFVVFQPGADVRDNREHLPPVSGTVYGGHFNERMTKILKEENGNLSPALFKEKIIPAIAMRSNFQNVIYDPADLRFWVSNAKNRHEWAASQPYTEFNLKAALK